MRPVRTVLSALLCLVLVATSGAMAVARGTVTDGTQVVICIGATVATVVLDENGDPVAAPHICPDCALHAIAGLTAASCEPTPSPRFVGRDLPDAARHLEQTAQFPYRARGPPDVI